MPRTRGLIRPAREMRTRALNPSRSLASRLAWTVVGAVAIALLVATALSVWREVDRYASDKRQILRTVAQVFAASGARAAAENDALAADATLRAIGSENGIVYAAIELPDGSLLSEQGIGLRLTRDAEVDAQADLSILNLLATRTLRVGVPVVDNARTVGRLVLVAETGDLAERVVDVALNSIYAGLLAVVVGLAVSLRLQRSVTRPLAALATTMDAVRVRHDYTQRASVVFDDEVGALAGTFNDLIGAVNERDRRLAEYSAGLEEQVRVRTLDLSEARQIADAANEAKSSFLATMSHEIRTPMNGMLVMAELLVGTDLPPRQRRYAEVIARSGQTLLAIINDVLDFAKVEAGKIDLERVPIRPAEIVDTVVTLFGERARTAGLDLAADVAPDVPETMMGDQVRLGQVLSNFVSNALKFTQAGHVLVRIDTCEPACGEQGRHLRIRVSDTGIGIPEGKLSGVFQAFSQADQSTTRRFGGTGLGLSIAQRLVAAMDGTIGVESRPGEGSTFWMRIPLHASSATEPATRRLPAVPAGFALGRMGPATRAVLAASLEASDFAPRETPDADCAIWIVEAAELMRLGKRPPSVKRVLALGAIDDVSGAQAVRSGLADELLRWPLTQSEWCPILVALAADRPFLTVERNDAGSMEAFPQYPQARVLVADDSAVNREVAVEALARCGVMDVTVVEDGQAALESSGRERFDLILMDGSMPVLDGFAASRAIRECESERGAARVPILALTAHVLGDAANAWQNAGMDGALAKPFTLTQLAEWLAALLPFGPSDVVASPEQTAEVPRPRGLDASDANPIADPIIDLETLDGLAAMGDGEFFERVLRLYERQAPVALAALEEAIAKEEPATTAQAAHSLKSMSASIGAVRLARVLDVVEIAARRSDLEPAIRERKTLGHLQSSFLSALYEYRSNSQAADTSLRSRDDEMPSAAHA